MHIKLTYHVNQLYQFGCVRVLIKIRIKMMMMMLMHFKKIVIYIIYYIMIHNVK